MQIIIIHPRLCQARTIALGIRHLLAVSVILCSLLGASVFTTYHLFANSQGQTRTLPGHQVGKISPEPEFVRENIAELARRVGQMQAQLLRLDALGARVSDLAGVNPSFNFQQLPAQGGALKGSQDLSIVDVERELGTLSSQLNSRADYLGLLEDQLLAAHTAHSFLPNVKPVALGFSGSSFGWRIDPFTGQRALHEGTDFVAPQGSPIVAAAGGVVTTAKYSPEFGNMIEVDHGKQLMTRYGHASKLLVKVGDIVRSGQKIAEVGSTGRSTGSHLHFELRVNGAPVDPQAFLEKTASPLKLGVNDQVARQQNFSQK